MFQSANAAQFILHIPAIHHDFKVLAFEGTEAISQLYTMRIELVSEEPDFDMESLLSQPAFLQFGLNGEGLHGRIEDVTVGEAGKRLTRYGLTLVPALHYLQFSHDRRIFQGLTVPQIIAQVLKGHGVLADAFTFNVTTAAPREYCTQYAESDFDFIQRLCAEDGIAWHHQHSAAGHSLVFTDHPMFMPKLDNTVYRQGSAMVAEHPVISRFGARSNTRTSTVTRRDYDFKRPSQLLERRAVAEFTPLLEDYRYLLQMDNEKRGLQLARQALERHRIDYQVSEGDSDQPTLRSGYLFGLSEHPRKSSKDLWLLLSVCHSGKQPQSLEEIIPSEITGQDNFTQGYRNCFTAIPAEVFFRPPLPTPRPPMVTQTARVTGPVGDEIYCDEYGRVKLEFPWDRAGHNSEKSSRWVRVSTSSAGERYGAVSIPRIGMEVVVTFLHGDPDHPLITGCVANTVNGVPYPLPEHKTKTVLRSHSSPHTGGYNELSIEDRAGQEQIYLRAERDLDQLIRHDSDTTIGNDRREKISRNSHSQIGGQRFQQVDGDSASFIKGAERHTTEGRRDTVIGSDELISISGNSSTTAGGTLVIQAGPHARVSASQVVIDAGTSLSFTAGGNHLVINASGIFSSVAIVEGGAPLPGVAPMTALSADPSAAVALHAPLLLKTQRLALMAKKPLCALCEAAQQQGGVANA